MNYREDPQRQYKQLREVIREYKVGFLNIPKRQIEEGIEYEFSKGNIAYEDYIALQDYLRG
ncbi:hypothetical protein P9X10_02315 [Bacillus cereus]|nr:hypothetical protein [Bacillus cereus]